MEDEKHQISLKNTDTPVAIGFWAESEIRGFTEQHQVMRGFRLLFFPGEIDKITANFCKLDA